MPRALHSTATAAPITGQGRCTICVPGGARRIAGGLIGVLLKSSFIVAEVDGCIVEIARGSKPARLWNPEPFVRVAHGRGRYGEALRWRWYASCPRRCTRLIFCSSVILCIMLLDIRGFTSHFSRFTPETAFSMQHGFGINVCCLSGILQAALFGLFL